MNIIIYIIGYRGGMISEDSATINKNTDHNHQKLEDTNSVPQQQEDDEDVYLMQFMIELKVSSQLIRQECVIVLAQNQQHWKNQETILKQVTEHPTMASVEQEKQKPQQQKIALQLEVQDKNQRKREPIEYQEKFSSMAAIDYNSTWKLGEVSITSFQLKFLFKKIHIQELDSIACSSEIVVNQKKNITLNMRNGNKIMFGTETETQKSVERLPLQYAWFAKIILSRLAYLGYSQKHTHDQKQISTYLGYAEKGTAINIKKIYSKGLIYYQRSGQEWVQCYAAINHQGLFIFETPQSSSCLIKQANRIFTDFRFYNEHLVVAIKGQQKQIWLGIPINAYNYNSTNNWLLSVYRLLRNID